MTTIRRNAKDALGQPVDRNAQYIAWQGFMSARSFDSYGAIPSGTRLPGTHELVQHHPENFVPLDTPPGLMPSPMAHALGGHQ